MNAFQISVYASEFLAAILATFYFYKYKNSRLKLFVFYLWYVVLHEAITYFLLPIGIFRFELINLYGLITPLYVIWTCKSFLASKKAKRLVSLFVLIICVVNLTEGILKGLHNEPWTISKITGPLLCVASFTIYLTSLFKVETVINPFKDIFYLALRYFRWHHLLSFLVELSIWTTIA